jgi:hypothetical protein
MKLKRLKTLIFVLQFANLYFLYLCLYCWIFLEKYLEKIEQISLEERKYQNSFGQMFWFKGRKLWNVFKIHFSKRCTTWKTCSVYIALFLHTNMYYQQGEWLAVFRWRLCTQQLFLSFKVSKKRNVSLSREYIRCN